MELAEAQQTVIIDTQVILPISIPFNPSSIGLETIDVPEPLNLQFLKRI
jgi:myosin-5